MVTAKKKRVMKRATNFISILVTLALVMMQTPVTYGFAASKSSSDSDLQQAYTLNVGLDFDHAYIEYDGQVVAAPASKITVPAGSDIDFEAVPDSGYEIDSVVAYVNGKKHVLGYEEGSYTIGAVEEDDSVSLSVSATEIPEPEPEEEPEAVEDDAAARAEAEAEAKAEAEKAEAEAKAEAEKAEAEAKAEAEKAEAEKAEANKSEGTTASSSSSSATAEKPADDEAVTDTEKAKDDDDEAATAAKNTKAKYVYSDDDVTVTAVLSKPEAVPANAKFQVAPILAESKEYNYDAYMEALNKSDESFEYTAENTLLYDVAFMVPKTDDKGNEVDGEWVEFEPEEGTVSIEIQFRKNQLSGELATTDSNDIEIKHLPLKQEVRDTVESTANATGIEASDIEVTGVDKAQASVDKEKVSFELDSLSGIAVITLQGRDLEVEAPAAVVKFVDAKGNPVAANVSGDYYLMLKYTKDGLDYFYVSEKLDLDGNEAYVLPLQSETFRAGDDYRFLTEAYSGSEALSAAFITTSNVPDYAYNTVMNAGDQGAWTAGGQSFSYGNGDSLEGYTLNTSYSGGVVTVTATEGGEATQGASTPEGTEGQKEETTTDQTTRQATDDARSYGERTICG